MGVAPFYYLLWILLYYSGYCYCYFVYTGILVRGYGVIVFVVYTVYILPLHVWQGVY
jgi:hypothetical protein